MNKCDFIIAEQDGVKVRCGDFLFGKRRYCFACKILNEHKKIRLDVKMDRKEIANIIKNCLPLIKENENFTQECADAIIVYMSEKGDEDGNK